MADEQINDPLNFMRNMWGNMGFGLPGMVTPTFDLEELDKRIKDLKAVEGWLRMNLSMLQMTIQGLEMQRSTVSAVQTMGQMAADAARQGNSAQSAGSPTPDEAGTPFSEAAMWPWQMMQQMREQMQHSAEAVAQASAATNPEEPAKTRRPSKK